MVKKATHTLTQDIDMKVIPMPKLSQFKIQQTAFMLIAVTLFFVMAGVLVLVFKVSDLQNSATALEEKNAFLLVAKLANSPELSCGNAYGNNMINCVDADKFMKLRDNLTKYRRFWGVKNIEIRKLYPETEHIQCNSLTYPNCTIMTIWPRIEGENYTSLGNYVSLCRKEAKNGKALDKCEMAKLLVDYEKRQ